MRLLVLLAVGLGLLPAAPRAEETLRLPFAETFDGPALPAGWAITTAPGNTVTVTGGRLEIRAAENTFAHLSRPLGVDSVRVSARIRPGNGISWCPSLFLYWGPGDWLQVGRVAADGGRVYVTEMGRIVGPKGAVRHRPREYYLGRLPYDRPAFVAIEMGRDVMRYLSSEDGTRWRVERATRRPAAMSGPPKFLVVGKGYSRGDAEYPQPLLANSYATAGPPAVTWMDDVRAERTTAGRLRATAAERRTWEDEDVDAPGRRVLEGGRDPAFGTVAPLFPAMRHSREAVGVAEHPDDIALEPDGSIRLIGRAPAAFRFMVGAPPVGLGGEQAPFRRRLLDGFLPIVVATARHDTLRYRLTLIGHSWRMSPDRPLYALARLEVENPSTRARPAIIELTADPPQRANMRWNLPIPARGRQTVCVSLPASEARASMLMRPADFAARLAEARAWWTRLLASGMQVRTPERRVNEAWLAWLAYNFLDVDRVKGVYEPHDGAGFYEEIYGYSAALYVNALDMWGYPQEARRYIHSLLTFQQPDGMLVLNFGLPDMGTLLQAMAQHHRFTADTRWLRGVAPRMLSTARWLDAARRKPDADPLTRGLIRLRPYCDFPEPTVNYFGNVSACAGMEQAADALARAGVREDARGLAQNAAAFRADILRSMDRAVIQRDGLSILPMEPDTHRILLDSGYRADDYYSLVALQLLECGFFAPGDPRARLVVDFARRRGGLRLGLARFRGTQVDHAYTYGYWLNCLQRDEPEQAILGLYGSLACGMTRNTYSGVEVTDMVSGGNERTLPHLYSGTQQLRLLRMMLVREDGDDLWLAQAAPRHWLKPGGHIEVERAPTFFGRLSYRLQAGRGRITAVIAPPSRSAPRRILLRLRHPQKRPIRAVRVNGRTHTAFHGETVVLTAPRGSLRVEARY